MGFNSAFKGLNKPETHFFIPKWIHTSIVGIRIV